MDITVSHGSVTEVESDALIVNLFEGVTSPGGATGAVDLALGGEISDLIASGEITGKVGETVLIHTRGRIRPRRVLVIGLGESGEFDLPAVRRVAGTAVRFLRSRGVRTVTSIVHGAGIGGMDAGEATRALIEGTLIGLYRSDLHKKPEEPRNEIESFTVVERDESKIPGIEAGIQEGRILAEATNAARTLGNEPANIITPITLAELAREVAQTHGLGYEELDEQHMAELGMGGMLSVGKGSACPPRMSVLEYLTDGERPTLALVGKAITFDTGGISIKPKEDMGNMKFDMAGGAAVIGAMAAIALIRPNINVLALIPMAENMLSGNAYRPGDVITCMSGKTVEIITTDAEGRMILADGITYAVRRGVDFIVDIATLTGGCVVALGHDVSGIMGNNAELMGHVKEAALITGERVWELPLVSEYKEAMKSSIADITNSGGRPAHAILGGLFLQEFVEETPWIHIDIAGTAHTAKSAGGDIDPGATGVGVRTLATLAMRLGS